MIIMGNNDVLVYTEEPKIKHLLSAVEISESRTYSVTVSSGRRRAFQTGKTSCWDELLLTKNMQINSGITLAILRDSSPFERTHLSEVING